MNTILGENLMLFLPESACTSGTGSGYVAVAYAQTCSMSLNCDPIELTSKDSGRWSASKGGRLSWNLSTSNLYSEAADALMNAAINRTVFEAHWSPAINTESGNVVTHTEDTTGTMKRYKGNVWISSINATASNGEGSTYDVQFTGTNALQVIE